MLDLRHIVQQFPGVILHFHSDCMFIAYKYHYLDNYHTSDFPSSIVPKLYNSSAFIFRLTGWNVLMNYARPPTDCGPVGSWAAVTLNFTVTSNGTQFDRLGIFTFQNVESE